MLIVGCGLSVVFLLFTNGCLFIGRCSLFVVCRSLCFVVVCGWCLRVCYVLCVVCSMLCLVCCLSFGVLVFVAC